MAWEIGKDQYGNPTELPKRDRGKSSRVARGMVEGFGEQPLTGIREQDRANYPTLSRYADPVAKSLDFVRRLPGAYTGAAAGAVGAGTEYLTGDSGYANYNQRQTKEFLDWLGIRKAAEPGMTPAARPTQPPSRQQGPSSPIGRGKSGEPIPMGRSAELHTEAAIQAAADATAQARQNAAVQNAINEAVRRSRTASPAQMTPEQIADMRRGFFRANPEYVPANARNMGVQEVRAAQDAFAGPPLQQPVVPIDFPRVLGEPTVSPVQRVQPVQIRESAPAPQQMPVSRQAAAPAPRDVMQLSGSSEPAAPAAPRPRDILSVASEEGAAAQQVALERANAATAGPAAAAPAQPWGAARPGSGASGLPPGSTVLPPRAPMSDPLKTKFPLSTEAQLYAAPLVALGTGEVLNQTGNAETMYPELFGPGKRARQAAINAVNAVAERQRIDDLDAAGGDEYRAAMQQPFAGADFFAPSPALEQRYSGTETAGMPLVEQRYSGTETAGMPLAPKTSAAVAAAKQPRGGKELPQPMRRPAEFQGQNSGFLSNLFANRPVSTADLYKQSQADPGDSGAWMRAERQYAATHPKEGERNFDVTKLNESGMARGGAANASPTKEALLHKSLEIIHHMLRSR